nr:hypothetical protein CFP56_64785 [Quercus suber]
MATDDIGREYWPCVTKNTGTANNERFLGCTTTMNGLGIAVRMESEIENNPVVRRIDLDPDPFENWPASGWPEASTFEVTLSGGYNWETTEDAENTDHAEVAAALGGKLYSKRWERNVTEPRQPSVVADFHVEKPELQLREEYVGGKIDSFKIRGRTPRSLPTSPANDLDRLASSLKTLPLAGLWPALNSMTSSLTSAVTTTSIPILLGTLQPPSPVSTETLLKPLSPMTSIATASSPRTTSASTVPCAMINAVGQIAM